MKKLFFILAIAAVATFLTSCDGKRYCYELKAEYSIKTDDNKITQPHFETYYDFNTPQGVNVWKTETRKNLKLNGCFNIKVTAKKVKHNQSDCEIANAEAQKQNELSGYGYQNSNY